MAGPRLGRAQRWLPKPSNFCPQCQQTTLLHVYHAVGISNPPEPNCFVCQSCGARWQRYFNGPLQDASDSQCDYYFGPDAPYYNRGEPDNGQEPMEVVTLQEGWARCPQCGRRFNLKTVSHSGKWPVHQLCGQRLIVI
ncbi:MAG: hypothetical protein EOO38_27805 [Cytophagaceae bacterium]|nr:MAG: hypothetical protein EOO38_27805 [Cytophagaceae bacterium]